MGVCGKPELFSQTSDEFPYWKRNQTKVTFWIKNLFTGLRENGSSKERIFVWISCGLVYSILCQPALGQQNSLNWMGTFEHPRGSRIEFSTPGGHSCRYEQGSRPSLNIGAGVSEGQILDGYGNTEIIFGPKVSKPSPVAGITLHIPLGVDKAGSCKEIMKSEEAMLKLQYAKQMMMDGLISEEELQKVVRQTYSTISEN